MVKSIFLQDGEEIFIDDEDYERVSQYTWCKVFNENSYKVVSGSRGKQKRLASFISGERGTFQIIRGNSFEKNNLSNGNHTRWNKAKRNSSSMYKGVSWHTRNNKWVAMIQVLDKKYWLGSFITEEAAAEAYNKAVDCYFDGEGYKNIIGLDNRFIEPPPKKHVQHKQRVGKTGYKGVYETRYKTFNVTLNTPKRCHVASFPTTHQAALAYNKCAFYLYGDQAILNDVPTTDELKEFISNWEIPEKILKLRD